MTSNVPVNRHHVVRAVRTSTAGPAPLAPSAATAPARSATRRPESDPEAVRVTQLVEALRSQWLRSGADIATRLRPGVDDARLDAVEREVGLLVPRGARAWWRQVDGVEPVRTRYRTSAPSVGPGGWVPLSLDDAVRRAAGEGPGPAAPPALLPMFARDEELLAVRLGSSSAQVEQVVLADDGDGYQHARRVSLDLLLSTWAASLYAAVIWLPDAHDWVIDPFALQALPHNELLD